VWTGFADLVPGVGEFADGGNALWYAAEGDWTSAGLSAAGAVPFAGWGATAAKLGIKGARAVGGEVVEAGIITEKVTGTITSVNQMQRLVNTGSAPSTIKRIDSPHIGDIGGMNHVHFTDGRTLNIDGTVSHSGQGVHSLTNKELEFLQANGWMMGQ
jgi:hypothetical protein